MTAWLDNGGKQTISLKYHQARYLEARLAEQRGDRTTAKIKMAEVLKADPRHPQANLELARLYAEDGNAEASAECRAAYVRYYGRE